MDEIKKKRLEGTNITIKKYVNVYEYTENTNLKILDFLGATEEWLDFIYKNRTSETLLHNYDIVKGPVANDAILGTRYKIAQHANGTEQNGRKSAKMLRPIWQKSCHLGRTLVRGEHQPMKSFKIIIDKLW